MSLTFTDIFCGTGGSSIGLAAAGFELKLAANHWDRAIETHAANFVEADHLLGDVSNYDMRRLPRTDVLWASPECTWHSPAGGRKRVRAQLDLFEEYVPDAAGVRSRATAFDVLRAAEVHRYKVIVVENVVEFAARESFDQWLDWLASLGYYLQLVNVSAAHIGGPTNPHAPQWRDRLYVVASASSVPAPDVRPRPLAWCPECDEQVAAVQSWKKPRARQVGKYGQQYVYRCPNTSCRNQVLPFVLPAAAAIDWTDPGTRIGDRNKPLAAATIRRIEAGLRMFAQPTTVAVHGNTWERAGYTRAWPAYDTPLNARTGTPGDGVAVPPMLDPAGGTWNTAPAAVDQPMRTREAEAVVCPPYVVSTNHGSDDTGRTYPVEGQPLATRSTKIGDGVVVPPFVTMLRNHAQPTGPQATVATGRHHYLTVPPGAFLQKHHGGSTTSRSSTWSNTSASQRRGSSPTAAVASRGQPTSRCTRSPPTIRRPWWSRRTRWRTATSGCCSPASICVPSGSTTPTSCTATRASKPCRPATPSPATSPNGSVNASPPHSTVTAWHPPKVWHESPDPLPGPGTWGLAGGGGLA
jgi:DNA (cytosine-5)-methyltransferase 1